MSAQVLIVKNIGREGPGLLRDVLQQHHITADMIELDRHESIPDPRDYAAMVVLGGPPSANDADAIMQKQIQSVHQAIENNVPYLGICLGLQVLVKAAGGSVVDAPIKEVGFFDADGNPYEVRLTKAAASEPMCSGLPQQFRVFQLHGETVVLGSDMELLGSAAGCPNQMVRVGRRAYGLQPHIELAPEMLAVWAAQDPELASYDPAQLQSQLSDISSDYMAVGKRLLTNFLAIAGLISSIDLTSQEQMSDVR